MFFTFSFWELQASDVLQCHHIMISCNASRTGLEFAASRGCFLVLLDCSSHDQMKPPEHSLVHQASVLQIVHKVIIVNGMLQIILIISHQDIFSPGELPQRTRIPVPDSPVCSERHPCTKSEQVQRNAQRTDKKIR